MDCEKKGCHLVEHLETKHNRDVEDIKKDLASISIELKKISPFVNREMKKAEAYKIVSEDVNVRVTSLKTWIPIIIGVIMFIAYLFKK